MTEATPNHSTLSRTRRLIDVETHVAVFTWVLERLAEAGLVKGKTVGVDVTTLEANAAMRSIERRDTEESYEEFVRRLAEASGIETPTRAELARFDRARKDRKTSNKEWRSPQDPDAKISLRHSPGPRVPACRMTPNAPFTARSKLTIVAMVVLGFFLVPPAAQAQTQVSSDELTIEWGLTGLASSSAGGGGVYVSVSGADRHAKWLEPFFAMNAFEYVVADYLDDTRRYLTHGGANIRLGPAQWAVRPVARIGIGWANHGERAEFTGVIGGVGLYTREASALWGLLTSGFGFTVDAWSSGQTAFTVAHVGVYCRFGG